MQENPLSGRKTPKTIYCFLQINGSLFIQTQTILLKKVQQLVSREKNLMPANFEKTKLEYVSLFQNPVGFEKAPGKTGQKSQSLHLFPFR
jgi:hypothetical protein